MGPGQHIVEQDLPLLLTGLAAGVVVGLLRRPAGRRWGAATVTVAMVTALLVSNRFAIPVPGGLAALAGAVVTVAAAVGTARVLRPPARWEPVAAGALVSVGAVWLAVPETGPVVVTAGVVAALAVTARTTGARWTGSAGAAVAASIGWAAASGAAGRPWASLGGALCAGMAPWLVLTGRRPGRPEPGHPGDRAGPAGPSARGGLPIRVLLAHAGLALLAARWIGAGTGAGWSRAALVAAAGIAVALTARP